MKNNPTQHARMHTEPTQPEARSTPRDHRNRRGGGVAPLRLTSMLDVCFLLLIFFVLTATFAVGEGVLPADLLFGPADPQEVTLPDSPVQITMHSLGQGEVSFQVEGLPETLASVNELEEHLKGLLHSDQNPDGLFTATDPVILHPDSTVAWRHVVGAYNAAVGARYTNIHFADVR